MIENPGILLKYFKACGNNITTDSRSVSRYIEEGKKVMFLALKGDKFDGNDFAAQALKEGASFVVVDNPWMAESGDPRILVVKDCLKALQDMARAYRRNLPVKILAITGSNGKTTTKELINRVLSKKYKVSATCGNLNNHIGVPLTLLNMPSDTEIGIIEMGANHRGEIKQLCAIAEPNYGIITNIGRAHLEGFGGTDGVKKGKGELFDYLRNVRGTAFFLEEDKTLKEMIAEREGVRKSGYSLSGTTATLSENGTVALKYREAQKPIQSNLVGEYNKYNIAAAVAIGKFFGIDFRQAAEAIENYIPDNNRSQFVSIGSNKIITDAYNANPSSMENALLNFAGMQDENKLVILGDMKELGKYSAEEHDKVLFAVKKYGFRKAWFVGDEFIKAGHRIAEKDMLFFPSVKELEKHIEKTPLHNYTILIKGSHSTRLEEVVPFLDANL